MPAASQPQSMHGAGQFTKTQWNTGNDRLPAPVDQSWDEISWGSLKFSPEFWTCHTKKFSWSHQNFLCAETFCPCLTMTALEWLEERGRATLRTMAWFPGMWICCICPHIHTVSLSPCGPAHGAFLSGLIALAWRQQTGGYTCMYMYTHMNMYTPYTYKHIYTHAYRHIHKHVTHTFIYPLIYAYTHTSNTLTYTHIYVGAYTYILILLDDNSRRWEVKSPSLGIACRGGTISSTSEFLWLLRLFLYMAFVPEFPPFQSSKFHQFLSRKTPATLFVWKTCIYSIF